MKISALSKVFTYSNLLHPTSRQIAVGPTNRLRLNLGPSKSHGQHHSIFAFISVSLLWSAISVTQNPWPSPYWRCKRLLIRHADPTGHLQTCPGDIGKQNSASSSDDIESRQESIS
jgi:hypothetical protein